jgi:hypothetical protein
MKKTTSFDWRQKLTHAVVCSMAIFALMACKVFGKRQLTKVYAIAYMQRGYKEMSSISAD